MLISHDLVAGSTVDVVDSNRMRVILPQLIVGNKLNREIIKEEKVLTKQAVDSLVIILTRRNKNLVLQQGGCFVPRQSIIIVKDSSTFYIDLCFHCHSYETSKDFEDLLSLNNQKWEELEAFFKQQGLTYKFGDFPE